MATASQNSKVGILAGGGQLPFKIAQSCKAKNIPHLVIGLKGFVDNEWLESYPHKIIRLGAAGNILKTLKKNGVERVVFAGHIRRPSWKEIIPDFKGALLIKKLSQQPRGDNALLAFLAEVMQENGFAVIGTQDIYDDGVTPQGIHTVAEPSNGDIKDIAYGVSVARQLGQADIGQAVVVQQELVLGIEAIEGTDVLVKRCETYKRKGRGPVLIKTKKPDQDERLDLPTIGVSTVENAVESGFSGIAVEAEQTLFLERDQAIDIANQHGIFIIGFNDTDLKI